MRKFENYELIISFSVIKFNDKVQLAYSKIKLEQILKANNMKRILITGASGFIGSFMVEQAISKGYEVYAGIRETSNKQYLKDKRIKFIELNFADTDDLKKTFSNLKKQNILFNYIIHNAGITKANKRQDYFTINYQYTKNIIEALIFTNLIPDKFVYMSSLAAHGPVQKGEKIMKLSDKPSPVTSYGKSKLQAENLITSKSNFPYIIIRPIGVYGPREKDFYIYFKLIKNHFQPLIGFNKTRVSFIYVKDLVKIIFTALESDIKNKTYFVSDGIVSNSLTFGNIIKKNLNRKTIKIRIPICLLKITAFFLEPIYGLFGKIPTANFEKINELKSSWICDIKPLENDFNFKADYNLKQGIYETTKWYKKENWL
ncbi:MAG: NAD(P)-dependent oxidoreductase [Bacteroidetes bacterium]|nr:NAD(P)-dependent oxidoreductase [Bacteroidota bacterium]